MTELTFDEFNEEEIKSSYGIIDGSPLDSADVATNNEPTPAELDQDIDINHLGLYQMTMEKYRRLDGLANSELQIFKQNPSSYIWNKTAPSDPDKVTSAEFGTALHSAILEPELFEDIMLVSDTKGRTAEAFKNMQRQNKAMIVLTQSEYDQINIMAKSTTCDPAFNALLDADGTCESSIFVIDQATGLKLKIRPDKIINQRVPIFVDVKSSANLEEWRNDRLFINPLFKYGYGFTAAYYLHAGSQHYGVEMTHYYFAVVSKSSLLGRYPVSVFVITQDELKELGFWQNMLDTLEAFAERKKTGDFMSFEKFPHFQIFDDESDSVTFTE